MVPILSLSFSSFSLSSPSFLTILPVTTHTHRERGEKVTDGRTIIFFSCVSDATDSRFQRQSARPCPPHAVERTFEPEDASIGRPLSEITAVSSQAVELDAGSSDGLDLTD